MNKINDIRERIHEIVGLMLERKDLFVKYDCLVEKRIIEVVDNLYWRVYLSMLDQKNNNHRNFDYNTIKNNCHIEYSQILDMMEAPIIKTEDYLAEKIEKLNDLAPLVLLENINVKEIALASDSIEDALEEIQKWCIISSKSKTIEVLNNKDGALKALEEREDKNKTRLYTGYPNIDDIVFLGAKNLAVISARPNVGKTTFALNVFNNIVQSGKKGIFFSFEMSSNEVYSKLSVINYKKPDRYSMKNYELYRKALSNLMSDNIKPLNVVEHSGMTVKEIRLVVERDKPDFIVIDQLDCMPVDKELKRHDLMLGENVIQLKQLAMDLGIQVILIHQLNRQSETRQIPTLGSLKDSGVIEQKADIVMMLIEEPTDGEDDYRTVKDMALIINKNRMGRKGAVKLGFNGRYSEFKEV